jgi:hypothetical protein
MKSRPIEQDEPSSEARAVIDGMLGALCAQAQAQFGNAIKSFWFHEDSLCPACAKRTIGPVKVRGEDALSINAFIYRERGVLIGYFLCEPCAVYILNEAQRAPYRQTRSHASIERNLIASYQKYLASLDT